jgi:glyoxylase-like metal-dependent hydrolase (beta-lactamase superfamily II)
MYVIDCGCMYLDKSLIVSGIHLATSKNRHPEAEWTDIPVGVFLIDHPDGKILFDTGCNGVAQSKIPPEAVQVSPYVFEEEQLLPERLRQMHIKPEEIRHVVMSHLHCDHAGNLSLFKNANIYVSDTEFTQSVKLYALKERYSAYMFSDFDAFLGAGLAWRLLENDGKEYALAEGVTIVNFGSGHSFGMLGLLVELPKSGNFLLVSDALYTKENAGPPIRLPGILYDSVGYVSTVKFIRKYAAEHTAQIIYGHNKEQFAGMTKSTDGYYD